MPCVTTPPQNPFKYPGYFPLPVNNSADIPTISGEEALWLYWKLKSFSVIVRYELYCTGGSTKNFTTSLDVTNPNPPHLRTCLAEQTFSEGTLGVLSLDFLNLPPMGNNLDLLNFNDNIESSIKTLGSGSVTFTDGGLVQMCQKDGEAVMGLRIYMPPLGGNNNACSKILPQIAIVPGGQADIIECQDLPYGWPLGAVTVGDGDGSITEVEFYNMSYWGDITCPEGYEEYCEEIAGV